MKRLIVKFQPWRVFLLTTSAVLVFSSLLIQPVYAITQNDLNSIFLNTPFYDPLAANCINATGTSVLNGSDNIEKSFNYFLTHGLNTAQAAAILGNLMEESGVNPGSVQSDGPGRGIAQWSVAGRWDKQDKTGKYLADTVYGFANGRDVTDLGVQLDFIWWEISEGPYTKVLDGLKKFTNSGDIDKATEFWMLKYESPDPKVAHLDIRQSDAHDAFNKYSGSSASSAAALCTGSGNFASNFVLYKQCNDAAEGISVPWAHVSYGAAGTVCLAGCGPSAMAMIITNLLHINVTPDITARYGVNPTPPPSGNLVPTEDRGGSLGDNLANEMGDHWGLQHYKIDFSEGAIDTVLHNGGLVLADGHGPLPFSIVGHYLVIRAVTNDNKWLIGTSMVGIDHLGLTLDHEYDPQQLISSTAGHHFAWAFCLKGHPCVQ